MSNTKTENITLTLNQGSEVKSEKKNIPASKDSVVFTVTRTSDEAVVSYSVQYKNGTSNGGELEFSDNKATVTVSVSGYRDTKATVSFSVDGTKTVEYELNMAPSPVAISRIQFADFPDNNTNCVDAYAGEEVTFRVVLSRKVRSGEQVKLQYKIFKKDPGGDSWKEHSPGNQNIPAGNDVVDVAVTAPANHSGSRLAISFFFVKPYLPGESGSDKTVRFFDILHRNGPQLVDVYWAENENIEFNNDSTGNEISSKDTVARKKMKNDTAFLHIRTHQMYGKTVTVKLYERDNTGIGGDKNLLVDTQEVLIMDNVACVCFSMEDACTVLKKKRSWEDGDYELFCAVSYKYKVAATRNNSLFGGNKVMRYEMNDDLKLYYKKSSATPSQSTLSGTQKFVINVPDDDDGTGGSNCKGKYCITKANYAEKKAQKLVKEVNIRLAGFGGNVPSSEFTDQTEKMIKQFQKDYMKVTQTGKICGSLLKAIDTFSSKYKFTFSEAKCKCGVCSGFGDKSNKGSYLSGNEEKRHKYEYPGMHRSLLWGLKAMLFYLEKDGRYTFLKINSGYRCRNHEEYKKKPTTNHMGKAMDLHFNKNGSRADATADMNNIRKDVFEKYMGAAVDWVKKDVFNLESASVGATSWVHFDVREFNPTNYLKDEFFADTETKMNGDSMVEFAKKEGFKDLCKCKS